MGTKLVRICIYMRSQISLRSQVRLGANSCWLNALQTTSEEY